MRLSEVLDLYTLHSNPKDIKGYDTAYETVPALAWEKYHNEYAKLIYAYYASNADINKAKQEIIKRSHIWAKDPGTAYSYAMHNSMPFPEGEDAIATDPYYAYWYAYNVLHGRFPKGEPVILADDSFGPIYKMDIKWNLI